MTEGPDELVRPRRLSPPSVVVLRATSWYGIQEAGGLASASAQPPGDGDKHGPQHTSRPTPYTSVVLCPHLGCPLTIPTLTLPPPWLHVCSTAHVSSTLNPRAQDPLKVENHVGLSPCPQAQFLGTCLCSV